MRTLAVLTLCTLALVACTDKTGEKKPASQIAAKVNKGEISIHQINFLLQRTPGLTPEKTGEARRQILDSLVDQELAVQQALAAKLDRDPQVMQALEASRREILAQAYLERSLGGKNRPTPEAVKAYFKDHPELFTQRKIYRLQEIAFTAPPEVITALREQLVKSRRAEDLVNAIRARGIQLTGGVAVKAAEDVSLDVLPRLAQMKDGESALFDSGSHASIVTVLETASQPLSEETARPLIEKFLSHRREDEMTKETLQQLRNKATIEYVGEFSQEAELARRAREAEAARQAQADREAREAARLAEAAAAARKAEEAKKAREAADAARAQSPGRLAPPADSTISKGISTLK